MIAGAAMEIEMPILEAVLRCTWVGASAEVIRVGTEVRAVKVLEEVGERREGVVVLVVVREGSKKVEAAVTDSENESPGVGDSGVRMPEVLPPGRGVADGVVIMDLLARSTTNVVTGQLVTRV